MFALKNSLSLVSTLPLSALLVLLVWKNSPAEDSFPYIQIVSSETADVLSGPGNSHYATDRIPKGYKVQVYRHDPGGYYAIRPTEGSFSLVLASAVQPTADPMVVEVKSTSAKAWVGSRLQGQFKPMWQVKLKSGELLNVVKKVEIAGAHSSQTESWYQVKPPRGEFRWIHKDNLGSHAPASVSEFDVATDRIQQSSLEVDLMNSLNAERKNTSVLSTGREGWKVLGTGHSESQNVSANEAMYDAQPFAVGFNDRLESIDLALSQMVVGPKQTWRLDSLAASVNQIRKNAVTGAELARSNELAEKIIGFQKVKAQSDETGLQFAGRGARLQVPNLLGSARNRIAENRRAKYDGEGVLRKLYVNGGVGPAIYALEDESGKVAKTISASTGVNLERFVGKPVGLFGKAGFNQRLKRPHLTAQRVVDLNTIR